MTSPPRIDSHQHFWRLARGDYGWLTPALKPIYRDFRPADLAPLLAQHDIASTILVQAAPTETETHHLLDIAAATPFVAGVVGWADFEAPDAPARIAALAADPLLVGLRPMAQDIPDPDWLAKPTLAPAFAALKEHGLVFDALVKPPQIPALLTLLEREMELPVVIDHGAKPDLTGADLSAWRAGIAALAARPNTTCKLSGLVTEAGPGWREATLAPPVAQLIACFGPERLLWGSDWPVATLAAAYDQWIVAAERLTATLTPAERAAIFGGNAARIYLTKRGPPPAMLKNLDPVLSADLLWVLAAMGHGDDLGLVDANHPAETIASATTSGRLIRLPGLTMQRAARAILSVLPIDDFEPEPVRRMEVVGDAAAIPDVQRAVQSEIDLSLGRPAPLAGIERFAFYDQARRAFAIVQVGDPRPYGCFLLRKGVIAGEPD